MTYSIDFRRKVFSIQKSRKLTFQETARLFGIGFSTLFRWKRSIQPKLTRNKPTIKLDMEALKGDIQSYPDAYQYEL